MVPIPQYDEKVSGAFITGWRKGCLIAFLILSICPISCGFLIVAATVTVQMNIDKWARSNIRDYSVTVIENDGGNHVTWREVIRDGKLISGETSFTEPSIDRMFEHAIECARWAWLALCQVEYDEFGYPIRYSTLGFDVGQEHSIELSGFVIEGNES